MHIPSGVIHLFADPFEWYDRRKIKKHRRSQVSSSHVHRRRPDGNDQTLLYAAIFEQSNAPIWVTHYGLTTEQFQQVFDLLGTYNFHLVDLSAWGVNGQLLQAGIFEESRSLLGKAHPRSPERFQLIFNQMGDQGYQLVKANGCALNGQLFRSGMTHI